MDFNPPEVQLAGIAPELALVVAAFVVLITDAVIGGRFAQVYMPVLSTLGLVASIVLAGAAWGETDLQFSGMIALDGFATFSKITLAVFGLLTVWLGSEYLRRDGIEESEFYGLVLIAVAGMMLMASAADLIVMFLALETFSIALYVLVGFRRRSLEGQESAMK
jgi:NADH-quinone oxidoreductase subunit N